MFVIDINGFYIVLFMLISGVFFPGIKLSPPPPPPQTNQHCVCWIQPFGVVTYSWRHNISILQTTSKCSWMLTVSLNCLTACSQEAASKLAMTKLGTIFYGHAHDVPLPQAFLPLKYFVQPVNSVRLGQWTVSCRHQFVRWSKLVWEETRLVCW